MKILKSKTHCAIQPLLFGCADNSLLQTATSNNIRKSESYLYDHQAAQGQT